MTSLFCRRLGLLVLLTGTGSARAGEPQVGIEHYRPITPMNRGFSVEGVRTLPHLQYASVLDISYARLPLRLTSSSNGTYDILQKAISGDLLMGVGLFGRLELDLGLPFIAYQAGQAPLGTKSAPPGGLGDVRFAVRGRLTQPNRWGVSLGAGLILSTPLGIQEAYINEKGINLEPRVVAEFQRRKWFADARLGFRSRPETKVFGSEIGNQFTFGLAGQYGLTRTTRAIAELVGATAADSAFFKRRRTPVEMMVGVRQQVGLFTVGVGAGPGLVPGFGAPTYRVVGSVGYVSVAPDTDLDGIPDADDRCPYEAEDRDGFEDSDGCPDPDNDKDGLLDGVDRCPNQAEDRDGFEDMDGCPDPDNDKDGIPDANDKCPNQPETKNDFEDEDGCPDEAPNLDSDGDGIKDEDDDCVNEPEDKDGFEDDDGCPDPDNDKDGIPDALDKCPNEPETINGKSDDDGCPDEGQVNVKVGAKELETLQPVFFDLNRSRIRHRFFSLLNQIALTLKAHPEIGRCAVEGHTDNTGPQKFNQELSVKRAEMVVKYMAARGVDPSRLVPIGQGQAMPWADNDTEEGRAKNRRVIFHIEGSKTLTRPTRRHRHGSSNNPGTGRGSAARRGVGTSGVPGAEPPASANSSGAATPGRGEDQSRGPVGPPSSRTLGPSRRDRGTSDGAEGTTLRDLVKLPGR